MDCHTASALLCRKLLVNIAVDKGADEGKQFAFYVDYLERENYVPPNGKEWVGHIKDKANEATHKVPEITADDAHKLVMFTEMLLKFIYGFPEKMRR